MKSLLLVILFNLSLFVCSQEIYYRSNELGMTLETIEEYRIDEFPYVLLVIKEGERETRVLTKDGVEYKRWELETDRGRPLRKRVVESDEDTVTLYNYAGRVEEERTYREGNLIEKKEFSYSGNLLSEARVYDGEGHILYRDIYYRDRDGRLMRIVRKGVEQERQVSAYSFWEGNILEEWHGSNNSGLLFRFNERGDVIAKERWVEGELQEREEFFLRDDKPIRTVKDNYKTGRKTVTTFTPDGDMTGLITTEKGRLIEEVEFIYRDGLLKEKRRRVPGMRETWRYEYDQDDELAIEEYWADNTLRKVIVYTGENSYYEELYRGGSAFLRIYYKDEQKVKEEFLLEE